MANDYWQRQLNRWTRDQISVPFSMSAVLNVKRCFLCSFIIWARTQYNTVSFPVAIERISSRCMLTLLKRKHKTQSLLKMANSRSYLLQCCLTTPLLLKGFPVSLAGWGVRWSYIWCNLPVCHRPQWNSGRWRKQKGWKSNSTENA